MQTVLMFGAILFIAWDLLVGFIRGFYPALVRLCFIALSLVGAYLFSATLSGILMDIPLPFLDGQTLQGAYEGYLFAQPGLGEALALAKPIEQLVLHFPTVLLAEINFLLLFIGLRLITLPFSALISRILFGKRAKKKKAKEASEEGKPVRAGKFRSGGMVIGLLQGVVCFAVVLVPIFGIVEFGERFHESFADAEETTLVDMATDIKTGIVDPVNGSPITAMCETVGLRDVAVRMFHSLSETTFVFSSGERRIDYFDYLESMFPAVSALIKLSNVDPGNMQDKDYENVAIVLHTAQNYEDIAQAVENCVTDVVEEFVEDSYREGASVVVERFTSKVVNEKENVTGPQLKQEVTAIRKTMKVIQHATAESASSAFEEVSAEELIDEVLATDILYETLVDIANDPESCDKMSDTFNSTEEEKADMADEINRYRVEAYESGSPEKLAKIIEITDAIAKMLELELLPLPGTQS